MSDKTMTENSVRRYRARKPIVVEAIQWTGENEEAVQVFVGEIPGGVPGFVVIRYAADRQATLWDAREKAWRPAPVGHMVVRGPLGARNEGFFALAPEDFAIVYDTDGALKG